MRAAPLRPASLQVWLGMYQWAARLFFTAFCVLHGWIAVRGRTPPPLPHRLTGPHAGRRSQPRASRHAPLAAPHAFTRAVLPLPQRPYLLSPLSWTLRPQGWSADARVLLAEPTSRGPASGSTAGGAASGRSGLRTRPSPNGAAERVWVRSRQALLADGGQVGGRAWGGAARRGGPERICRLRSAPSALASLAPRSPCTHPTTPQLPHIPRSTSLQLSPVVSLTRPSMPFPPPPLPPPTPHNAIARSA
jgi:hypothetical protein